MTIGRAWRNFLNPFYLLLPIPIISAFWRKFSLHVEVANGNLKVERGLISKDISKIGIEDINDIQVNKSLFQRLLGLGDLGIATAGTAGHEVVIDGIGEPMKIQEKIKKSA